MDHKQDQDLCPICKKSVENPHSRPTVTLTEKGALGIMTAKKSLGDIDDINVQR